MRDRSGLERRDSALGSERGRSARLRVWAPIALRGFALGIALIGLAGIGSVMGRTPGPPRPGPAPAALSPGARVSHAELGLAALSARALAVVTEAGTPPLSDGDQSAAGAALGGEPRVEATPSQAATVEVAVSQPAAAEAERGPCVEAGGDPGPHRSPRATRDDVGKAPSRRSRSLEPSGAPVVLNRADAAELRRLPGVGAKRAEAILALRARLGRFRRPSDLLRIKGIGPRTLERMLPHLVLD